MTCRQAELAACRLIDGEVDALERVSLEEHTKRCERCRSLAADLSTIRQAALSLGREIPDEAGDLKDRTLTPALAPPARIFDLKGRGGWWIAAGISAAAAAIGLVAVLHRPAPVATAERLAPAPTSVVSQQQPPGSGPRTPNSEPRTMGPAPRPDDAWIDEDADPNVIVVRVPTKDPTVHIFWMYETVTLAQADGGKP